jgi:two-component system sensor histidine kinase HydH
MAAEWGTGVATADPASRRTRISPWLANLLAFGLMVSMVLGWFSLQSREAQRLFLRDTGEHARLLADAVALHARGAVLAQQATESLLTGFLFDTARFIDYLDQVEPFNDDELTALAREKDLVVIRIERDGSRNRGRDEPRLEQPLDCRQTDRLQRFPNEHLALYGIATGNNACVWVGMDSRRFERIRDAVGLPRAIEAVSALPGVLAASLSGEVQDGLLDKQLAQPPEVTMDRDANGQPVARARVPLAGAYLDMTLDAGSLRRMQDRQLRAFLTFTGLLMLTGGLLSWLLYRRQQAHLGQIRDYERRLSQQREEAGLGRAAAAIAHEIRNPLNAIGMGLQRLQIEATELDPGHRRLVALVREAVERSNQSITGLLDYARTYQPQPEKLDLANLLRDILTLYQARFEQSGIDLDLRLPEQAWIEADTGLIRRVLDNLLRNVLEAQPEGGWLSLALIVNNDRVHLSTGNGGLDLPADRVQSILEPWFTTRPEGTGLGLAICRRIVAAHGGQLRVAAPREGELRLDLTLPRQIQRFSEEA